MGKKYEFQLSSDMLRSSYKGDKEDRIPEETVYSNPKLAARWFEGKEMNTKFGIRRLWKIKGGGWVEFPSNLSQSGDCWIDSGAIVCGNATVVGNARVKSGQVGDNAYIGGNAEVSGNSVVRENAFILGKVVDSSVRGSASVMATGEVVNGAVSGSAKIYGKVNGSAVSGSAMINGEVNGEAYVGGDSVVMQGAVVSGKFGIQNTIVTGTVKKG